MSRIFCTEGIIFKTIKYSETSVIADIYTQEKGLKTFIVSGVRSTKSNSKAAILRPCNFIHVIAYEQDAEKLSRIKELNLSVFYRNININVLISSISTFMLEVCRNAIKEKEANSEMYEFLKGWFIYIDDESHYSNLLHLKFLLEFSYLLGFGPLKNHSDDAPYFDMMEGSFCNYHDEATMHLINENTSLSIAQLLAADLSSLKDSHISRAERNDITDHLLQYYKWHISGFKDINSLMILRSVL